MALASHSRFLQGDDSRDSSTADALVFFVVATVLQSIIVWQDMVLYVSGCRSMPCYLHAIARLFDAPMLRNHEGGGPDARLQGYSCDTIQWEYV